MIEEDTNNILTKNKPRIYTPKYQHRIDYFLHRICEKQKLFTYQIPPNTPETHWWWKEASTRNQQLRYDKTN
jgi:hypothetical protein